MTRTLRYLLLFVFVGLSGSSFAQEIAGQILDDKKEPLPSAVIQVYQGGILKGANVTDFDGNYLIKPLDAGTYDVLVLYAGYDSILVNNVIVTGGNRTTQNFTMAKHTTGLPTITVKAYKKPLVNVDNPGGTTLTREELTKLPTTEVTDAASLGAGVYQNRRGGGLNLGGARSGGTVYFVDGVRMQGTASMAQGSIDQMEVLTSGIPANYGDLSGGVVNITSRGVSQRLTGNARLQHSIDGYKNNLATFSIAGPIYKKKAKGENGVKKPVLGFALSGDYYNDKNRYPSYDKQYIAKADVLDNLQKNPLLVTTDNSGAPVYQLASNYITKKDLVQVKIPPHNELQQVRLNGKLDYQVTDNMRIVGGGNLDYTKRDNYNRALIMFSPQATPLVNTTSANGYLRFTQKFGKSNDTNQSIISNAYYTVQADYQIVSQKVEDPVFKKNIFQYAYIGKFDQTRTDIYFPGQTDSATKRIGTVLVGNTSTGVSYTPSDLNPYLANYTKQYYSTLNGLNPRSIAGLQAAGALANGDEPLLTYGLNFSPGTTLSSYSNFSTTQYAITVDASFDLMLGKTRHAIGFGLYYQQRIERSYSANANLNGIGTTSLWSLMRGLVSSVDNGNLALDRTNPIFKVNGKTYTLAEINSGAVIPGPTDTIVYNYKNVGSSAFDRNLREKLKLSSTQNINIDSYDPNTFSLNMFSADELLNSGNQYVSYYGYNYDGTAQSGTVNFNDFWTQKDKNGNFTRPIGAYSPNYIAGYIMDKFTYKDVHFNVGVRVDRFSSNAKVLKDPYSFYAEKTVSEVSGINNTQNKGQHPGNIGGDYVVYVDDNNSTSPSIIGYRSGNNWYDPTGKYIENPDLLKQYSGGRNPQPYLVNPNVKITDTNFNPNLSFTDYTPQVTVQPRIQFSFPISEVADFYAHYDIYTQRPSGENRATPVDYFFINQNQNSVIANPNLRAQKTFDYELGFQQKLTDHSALTITAFYKERKDMIATVLYKNAWPITYFSYANRDFSTTKGSTLVYDLRATNHLRMNVAYTLQFAEGTGSTSASGRGLLSSFLESGLPNLRYILPMDWDSRHNIAANIDYRYNDGEGPMIAGKNVFQNAGVNIITRARSGEPYTRLAAAQGNTVVGGVNGSRLPWHFGVDFRLDKDFALSFGKKNKDAIAGVKPRRPMYLKATFQVNNLLNTREVMAVYGYTGRPDDNGYLASPFGQQFVPQQLNQQSYTDMYRISINNPNNLNYARTMSVGLDFNF